MIEKYISNTTKEMLIECWKANSLELNALLCIEEYHEWLKSEGKNEIYEAADLMICMEYLLNEPVPQKENYIDDKSLSLEEAICKYARGRISKDYIKQRLTELEKDIVIDIDVEELEKAIATKVIRTYGRIQFKN